MKTLYESAMADMTRMLEKTVDDFSMAYEVSIMEPLFCVSNKQFPLMKIRIIYDKFANTTMGIAAIATSFVKGVLDNPVYCGKLAFGRRKNEKIPGTRNEYHIVKQDNYMLNDGIHEAIVSEELWNQVHKKRQEEELWNRGWGEL